MGLLQYSPGKTRIKICGLRDAAAVNTAVEAGADAIGLVFYPPSPRAVSTTLAAELMRDIPAGVDAVALLVNPSEAEVAEIRANLPITLWQFHGDESPADCIRLAAGQPWLKAARIGDNFAFANFSLQYDLASGFLLDALVDGYGGGGLPFNWQGIPQLWLSANAHRVVLSGGLNVRNVGEAIARLRPCAVDISSGVEITKGVKDPALIRAFIEAVRATDTPS
ncbi:MAG: phosphoribosylanthranilate isomerase [Burkholderiaceae bacterium]|nr:phosphoribosylanthranilate isomerase [Burkholderiaceae bacterium]